MITLRAPKPRLQLNTKSADEIRKTTCYMCACRCGINVHLKDGKVRYIEGNRDHPVNRGVLCAKGSAGIMQHYSPARLRKPLLRVGPRGSSEFREIEWEEALEIATKWLGDVRKSDPKKLAFFTGRDQSQALTGWWAQQFGTPNFAAHGGFCSVNMAAAGIYTVGSAFWEFGTPDWERTKLFVLFGVAEDHDSNPIKLGIAKLKRRGVRIVSVNPVRTGYSAVADDWLGIRPGTDGLLIQSLIYELFRTRSIDLEYLIRYTNAGWLIYDDPRHENYGLVARDEDGEPLVWDSKMHDAASANNPTVVPDLGRSFTLQDGAKVVSVFALMVRQYTDEEFSPAAVADRVGIEADVIQGLASELARTAFEEEITIDQRWTDTHGRVHDKFVGRPVSFHAMRGISAHSNGFQTCRALHVLQILLGAVECPGGFRFKPPYPKPPSAHPKPAGKPGTVHPNTPLSGPPLGYPLGPEDLLVDDENKPVRIDKAFSWENPLSVHGMMHMVIANAHQGDPYPIDVLFLYMANMAWNSSMNTRGVIDMLTDVDEDTGEYRIPKIIYSDAYASEMVSYADLILPDTTYLERHDCISLLDRPISEPDAVGDAIRWPVVEPDRDVIGFQSVLLDLGARLHLPGFVTEENQPKYKDYADYIVRHERKPGVGPLMGWRGLRSALMGRGEPNVDQLSHYINNGGFCHVEIPEEARFFKHANQAYQKFAVDMGFIDSPQPYVFQLYSEPLQKFRRAALGYGAHNPPEHLRARIEEAFHPLPLWYAPYEGSLIDEEAFPIHALTQRPMAMYHSWGSQNAWLRQIHTYNPLYVPTTLCDRLGLKDGDWAWVISHHGKICVPVKPMVGVNHDTVWTWNAIGKRKGAWALAPGAPEATKGFLLNHLISELLPTDKGRLSNSDPITGQAAWFDLRVRIEKADGEPPQESQPAFASLAGLVGMAKTPDVLQYGKSGSAQ